LELDLSLNDLDADKMDSFAAEITKLFNLQQLNLNNNQLTVVKAEWFKNLQNLDVLNLEANLLKGLDADAFRELIHLKRISLGKLRPQLGG
jgi:Leucine-rich repeat (LRR) protein